MKKILSYLVPLLMAVCCSAAIRLNSSVPENAVHMKMKAVRDGSASVVVYGTLQTNLTFVVFQNGMESVTNEVQGDSQAASDGSLQGLHYLVGKNGKKIILNNSFCVYELGTNKIMQVPLQVSLAEFEGYLKSCRTNYTLDSLYKSIKKPLPKIKTIPR